MAKFDSFSNMSVDSLLIYEGLLIFPTVLCAAFGFFFLGPIFTAVLIPGYYYGSKYKAQKKDIEKYRTFFGVRYFYGTVVHLDGINFERISIPIIRVREILISDDDRFNFEISKEFEAACDRVMKTSVKNEDLAIMQAASKIVVANKQIKRYKELNLFTSEQIVLYEILRLFNRGRKIKIEEGNDSYYDDAMTHIDDVLINAFTEEQGNTIPLCTDFLTKMILKTPNAIKTYRELFKSTGRRPEDLLIRDRFEEVIPIDKKKRREELKKWTLIVLIVNTIILILSYAISSFSKIGIFIIFVINILVNYKAFNILKILKDASQIKLSYQLRDHENISQLANLKVLLGNPEYRNLRVYQVTTADDMYSETLDKFYMICPDSFENSFRFIQRWIQSSIGVHTAMTTHVTFRIISQMNGMPLYIVESCSVNADILKTMLNSPFILDSIKSKIYLDEIQRLKARSIINQDEAGALQSENTAYRENFKRRLQNQQLNMRLQDEGHIPSQLSARYQQMSGMQRKLEEENTKKKKKINFKYLIPFVLLIAILIFVLLSRPV